jgi:transcriptional regulator with XRE-family HTH domain
MNTQELQKCIKELIKQYGWSQKKLAEVLDVYLNDDDGDDERLARFEESLRKQLNRPNTSPEKLNAYLEILTQESKFNALKMIKPKPLPTTLLDKELIENIAEVSKLISKNL